MIACVEPVTTPTTTASQTTATSKGVTPTPSVTSGTTVVPTSVETTTPCTKEMAQVGTVLLPTVRYSITPIWPYKNEDLTTPTGEGISFAASPALSGIMNDAGEPRYYIDLMFNPAGASALSSVLIHEGSNVLAFDVQIFVASNPTEPVTVVTSTGEEVVTYSSRIINELPSVTQFNDNIPSPIIGVRVLITSTEGNV